MILILVLVGANAFGFTFFEVVFEGDYNKFVKKNGGGVFISSILV